MVTFLNGLNLDLFIQKLIRDGSFRLNQLEGSHVGQQEAPKRINTVPSQVEWRELLNQSVSIQPKKGSKGLKVRTSCCMTIDMFLHKLSKRCKYCSTLFLINMFRLMYFAIQTFKNLRHKKMNLKSFTKEKYLTDFSPYFQSKSSIYFRIYSYEFLFK